MLNFIMLNYKFLKTAPIKHIIHLVFRVGEDTDAMEGTFGGVQCCNSLSDDSRTNWKSDFVERKHVGWTGFIVCFLNWVGGGKQTSLCKKKN